MASFHYSVIDVKKGNKEEVYTLHSIVDDKRFGLLFDKEIVIRYLDGHTFIPKQGEQLKGLSPKLIPVFKATLKTFIRENRLKILRDTLE